MKKKDIKTWINALRSGEYKQCEGKLHGQNEHGDPAFCCLGVAIDVLIEGDWKKAVDEEFAFYQDQFHQDYQYWTFDDHSDLPSEKVLLKLGLNEQTSMKLADMNDEGSSFSEIADYIEKQMSELIKENGALSRNEDFSDE